MSNDKAQMPNQAQMSNSKKFKHFDFGIHLTFGFWHLDFGLSKLTEDRHA
jgi:hypothetical protein